MAGMDELSYQGDPNEWRAQQLQIEEADAWAEYLEATRGQVGAQYYEVEPWASVRLDGVLEGIKLKRARYGISEPGADSEAA